MGHGVHTGIVHHNVQRAAGRDDPMVLDLLGA
jgi:hypothetical protein